MASHFDRAGFSDDLKFRRSKRFVKFGICDDGPAGQAGLHGDSDHAADGGVVSIDMRSLIGFAMPVLTVMIMNRSHVPVVIAACVLGSGMHVERQCMRLQGADRRRNHDRNAGTHAPSVLNGWPGVNGRTPAA